MFLCLKSFSLAPYCMGKYYPREAVKAFCFGEAASQEMKDGGWPLEIQPQRQEAHRAIVSSGLVFSALCSITIAKTQINSIWWLAETPTQWVQPTFKYTQDWSRHMGYTTAFPRCNVTALCCATPLMYCHISLPIVSETSDECETTSACLVWLQCQVQNMCQQRQCKYVKQKYFCTASCRYSKMQVDYQLCGRGVKIQGQVRSLTVNDNPKSDLDIRYRTAVSDSEECLMPKLAWYWLAVTLPCSSVSVYLCVLLARESSVAIWIML